MPILTDKLSDYLHDDCQAVATAFKLFAPHCTLQNRYSQNISGALCIVETYAASEDAFIVDLCTYIRHFARYSDISIRYTGEPPMKHNDDNEYTSSTTNGTYASSSSSYVVLYKPRRSFVSLQLLLLVLVLGAWWWLLCTRVWNETDFRTLFGRTTAMPNGHGILGGGSLNSPNHNHNHA